MKMKILYRNCSSTKKNVNNLFYIDVFEDHTESNSLAACRWHVGTWVPCKQMNKCAILAWNMLDVLSIMLEITYWQQIDTLGQVPCGKDSI